MNHIDSADITDIAAEPPQRPWFILGDTYDVEAWIANYNRDLQAAIVNPKLQGYGICFYLSEGGELFLHTGGEGDVVLTLRPKRHG